MPTPAALAAVEAPAPALSAARLRRRGAHAQGAAGRGLRRPRLPAAGRRLCRGLRRLRGRQDPGHAARAPADGGRAHLRRRPAGGEARPHRRPVREAALGTIGGDRRHGPAELSRRHRQRHRVRARRAASPTPTASSRPTPRRPPRSTCCAPSPRAATPRSPASTSGRWASSTAARRPSATATWRTGSPRRWSSCRLAASPTSPRPRSTAPRSTPRTRRCCSASSRR